MSVLLTLILFTRNTISLVTSKSFSSTGYQSSSLSSPFHLPPLSSSSYTSLPLDIRLRYYKLTSEDNLTPPPPSSSSFSSLSQPPLSSSSSFRTRKEINHLNIAYDKISDDSPSSSSSFSSSSSSSFSSSSSLPLTYHTSDPFFPSSSPTHVQNQPDK
jgi:hypothetical protein